MMDLWQKLTIELDSLKLAVQLLSTQRMLQKDKGFIQKHPGTQRQLEAISLFARRAAEIVAQLEKEGQVVHQQQSTDPITQESEEAGHVLGSRASIGFPMFNKEVEGKIDTGATTSSLHATDIRLGNGRVSFKSELLSPNIVTLPVEGTQEVHSADFGGDKRPIVRMDIEVAGVPLKGVMFNLNDRSKMDSKLLIGQDVLKAGNFHVDVSKDQEAPASEALPDAQPTDQRMDVPESVKEFHNKQLYEAVQLLVNNNVTLADLVAYLRTEAVNRIKD
jgi:hypothetical protein